MRPGIVEGGLPLGTDSGYPAPGVRPTLTCGGARELQRATATVTACHFSPRGGRMFAPSCSKSRERLGWRTEHPGVIP